MKITMLPKFIIATTLLYMPLSGQAQADYEEIGGVVVIEAESLNVEGTGWIIESDRSNFDKFTGKGYIRSPQGNIRRIISSTTIPVKIKINNPGKYILKVKSQIGAGNSDRDSNDSWIKFEEATVNYFAEKPTSKFWPVGSGKSPNIEEDGGVDGFFKVYSSGGFKQWTWFSRTCNGCSHPIFAEFDNKGVYTLLLSSRSEDYLIDRIVLSKKVNDIDNSDTAKLNAPEDAETPENNFRLAVSTFDLSKSGIAIYPNPVQGLLNIKGLKNTTASIELIDALGRVLPAKIQQQNDTLQIDTTALAPGLYFVRIGQLGQSAFVVK